MDNKQPIKKAHVYGKSLYKTTISQVFVCACGNKYLKTRDRQNECLACLRKAL